MTRIWSTTVIVLCAAGGVGCQSDGGGDPEGSPRFSTELGAEAISSDLGTDESPQEGGGILD